MGIFSHYKVSALHGCRKVADRVDCSCTGQKAFAEEGSIDWIQLWHIGARALTFNATCRAAAAQLHAMLAANLVEYHQIAESVDTIITSADINGPAILCDSSIFLMIHLLNTRVIEVPGTSLIACQHVTRWLFARWNPGTVASHP